MVFSIWWIPKLILANNMVYLLISYDVLYDPAEIIMWLLTQCDSGDRPVEGCHHQDAYCHCPIFLTWRKEIHI